MGRRFRHLLTLYLEEKASHQQHGEFLEMVASGLYDKEVHESLNRDIELEMAVGKLNPKLQDERSLLQTIKKAAGPHQNKHVWNSRLINSFHIFLKSGRKAKSISNSNIRPH